jgi:hypothetical protein
MTTDAKSQESMIAALDLKSLFNSAQLGFIAADAMTKPDKIDVNRAVANIRVWRKYLPEGCVAAMINDGWQWST